MAYKHYTTTWLSTLPYELQDVINNHYNRNNFKDVMDELYVETTNDIPLSNVLVSTQPTKYEILLEEIVELLIQKSMSLSFMHQSETGYISIPVLTKYVDKFILFNYKYSALSDFKMDSHGASLHRYFTGMISQLYYTDQDIYQRAVIVKNRLTILSYLELLKFKDIVKNDRYQILQHYY